MHYPGLNYMGPGTHAVKRIMNDVKPNGPVDSIAQLHDVDFLTDDEPIYSDLKAIARANQVTDYRYQLQASAMKLGLGTRSMVDALLHLTPFPNITHINVRTDNMDMSNEDLRALLLDRIQRSQH